MYMVSAAAPAREPLHPAGIQDLADSLVKMLDTVRKEIERDREAAKALIARAFSLLQIEVERSAATTRRDTASGGLAAWQIHRVRGFIEGHIDEAIRVEDLSEMVRLSATHFFRAFKRSVGDAPHTYLVRRRLDRARHLMLSTDAERSGAGLRFHRTGASFKVVPAMYRPKPRGLAARSRQDRTTRPRMAHGGRGIQLL
jgi:AraC-like DNA-binding protein